MAAYYNEFDPSAAAWLRELIKRNLIADGDVDERSITDVSADDVRGYTQCHFFAGIGGWSYALRLAGWPDDHPVWTGSCPCQAFSTAGQQRGFQVEGAVAHGWLDLVSSDLEGEGYAIGAHVLGAHSVGRAHIRQRLYFVADAMFTGRTTRGAESGCRQTTWSRGPSVWLANAQSAKHQWDSTEQAHGEGSPNSGGMGDTLHTGPQGHGRPDRLNGASGWQAQTRHSAETSGLDWVYCRDKGGVYRPIESGLEPVAHGLPARVGRLRGYGNAIVPQVAAAFIEAYLDVRKAS